MNTSRRTFMITIVATSSALSATRSLAQATLDEKDPQAVALSYVGDTAKVDAKKFPKHDNTQLCSGCALWQSKPTDTQGNCALFAGKQVSAKGWCSAWARKR
ncbi:high-potential iron-sulfur protein [Variovorax sp. CY25R-8]|uniref:high-potential iron-sulfur protein n=1 Tax=Variovorax sp. CY25R-8 TaxID=2855501 RepID=UPI0021BAE4FE|nr:high-potential iron-sulfur protein [Variovorax sp. CY25R-8]MCT8177153.1 high-potential iron-sulfur protein [Variovorax sp. CY25R-8]